MEWLYKCERLGHFDKNVNHLNIVFHQPVPPCKMLGEIYRSLGSRENWEHLSAPDLRLLRGIQHVALECFRICYFHNIRYGDFLKWWYPTTIGSPAKSDHFGVFWGCHLLRKHPQVRVFSANSWQSHIVELKLWDRRDGLMVFTYNR